MEQYKKQFTAKSKNYPVFRGTKIRNAEIYESMVEQAEGPHKDYFPAYRK